MSRGTHCGRCGGRRPDGCSCQPYMPPLNPPKEVGEVPPRFPKHPLITELERRRDADLVSLDALFFQEIIDHVKETDDLMVQLADRCRDMMMDRSGTHALVEAVKAAQEPAKPSHVCGLQGFGRHLDDVCPACEAREEREEQRKQRQS